MRLGSFFSCLWVFVADVDALILSSFVPDEIVELGGRWHISFEMPNLEL